MSTLAPILISGYWDDFAIWHDADVWHDSPEMGGSVPPKGSKGKGKGHTSGQPQRIRRLSELDPALFTAEQVIEAPPAQVLETAPFFLNDDEDAEFMLMH